MAGDEADPITNWIRRLQAGDPAAAQPLWERYFTRLVQLARARLARAAVPPTGAVDGEDIALSAFNSFCLGAARGRFPQLGDRNDLWRLLLFITAQKVADHHRRRGARKRGGNATRVADAAMEQIVGREPTPEFAAMVTEEVEHLLNRLGDDMLRHIALWKMEGYTNQEISARLGCAVRTVANKLDLIRKSLQTISTS
jgi:DNA-directed RNA polymerase specialized sigma24 family protein